MTFLTSIKNILVLLPEDGKRDVITGLPGSTAFACIGNGIPIFSYIGSDTSLHEKETYLRELQT